MEAIPGARCAGLLVALNLPFDSMVRCLMADLDLTYDQAAVAILTVQSVTNSDAADRAAATART